MATHRGLFLFLSCITVISKRHVGIVGDCGSTGSRIFAYQIDVDGGGHVLSELSVRKVATLSPGVSTQWRSGTLEDLMATDVVDAIEPIIREVEKEDGDSIWHGLTLLGTGGIRRMNATSREDLWTRLKRELITRLPGVPIQVGDIPGELEALYALTSVSYLYNGDVGVLDLGGRSLEVSNPPMPPLNSIEALQLSRLPTEEEVLVEVVSLDIGERNMKKWIHFERHAEEHLCIYTMEGSVGNADGCRGLLREYLDEHRGPVLADFVARDIDYVGIGLFIHAIDFANWLEAIPSYPHVTVEDLLYRASEAVCSTPFNHSRFITHPSTQQLVEARGRCADICYIGELLRDMNLSKIIVGHPVDGVELEWTLGYFLRQAATIDSVGKEEL